MRKKVLAMVFIIMFCEVSLCSPRVQAIESEKQLRVLSSSMVMASVAVTDIDLGDYQSEMAVGSKQILMVTVRSVDLMDQKVTYKSSNITVATINEMGRITAVGVGKAVISVKVGSTVKTFALTVKAATDSNVAVSDIDLGDYQKEMELGTTQLITATVLPLNAINQKVKYQSSNTKIATINEMGRISALKLGTTTITVKACNKVEKKVGLTVKKSTEKVMAVTDIEISDFKEELEIEKEETITVKVFPLDATDQTVEYKSSNPEIAEINSFGKIIALKKGKTIITVKAGNVVKKLNLIVKVPATNIVINEPYLVMGIGDKFQLEATAVPNEAKQTLIYSTTNSDIISVSQSGLVKGLSTGNAAVIITNGDIQASASVIIQDKNSKSNSVLDEESEGIIENKEGPIDDLVKVIENSKDDIIVLDGREIKVISKEALKDLQEARKSIVLRFDEYTITIRGDDILNYENEFIPNIKFENTEMGTKFTVNKGKSLPGVIAIEMDDKVVKEGRYLYLFNHSKDKYQLLRSTIVTGQIELDTTGSYLIREKELSSFNVNIIIVIIGVVCLLGCIGVYIFVKKKYWFW